MTDQLLMTQVVADRLSLSERSVRRLISAGELPVVRIGRSVRMSETALGNWIAAKVQS
jgi:excisionase family DNA binding protein